LAAIRQLYDLQLVDLELDRREGRLREIRPLLGNEGPLVAFRAKVSDLEEAVSRVAARQKDLDDAIKALSQRIAQAEQKMYGGTVRIPRELADLQADVTQHTRQRSDQEDQLLVVLDEADGLRGALESAQGQLQAWEANWQSEQAALLREQAALSAEVAQLSTRRGALAGQVPSAELDLYDRIRKSHNGKAVARVDRGSCDACRVSLPTRQIQELRTATTPVRCFNCGRILLAE